MSERHPFADAALSREAAREQERFERRFGPGRRVLLIGGGGYIGAPVAAYLLRQGMKVRSLDAFVYPSQSSVSGLLLDKDFELCVGDFGDPSVLSPALDGVTDVVVLGGLVGDPITKTHPTLAQRINVEGITQCLEQLAPAGLNKLIFISTCSNYGLVESDQLANEDSELKPLSLYAEAKVAAEKLLLSIPARDTCPVVLRFATAFGAAPRMRFDLTVNEFTRELFAGNRLEVYDADTWRPYCHVRDFARLIHMVLLADQERVKSTVFNAGGERNNHTKRSIVEIITANLKLPDGAVLYRDAGSDRRNYKVDFSRVRERLGFEPAWSVEQGVSEMLELLSRGFYGDVEQRRPFYGNYEIDESNLAAVTAIVGPEERVS